MSKYKLSDTAKVVLSNKETGEVKFIREMDLAGVKSIRAHHNKIHELKRPLSEIYS